MILFCATKRNLFYQNPKKSSQNLTTLCPACAREWIPFPPILEKRVPGAPDSHAGWLFWDSNGYFGQ